MRYEIRVMRYEICLIFKPIISQPITHNPYHISYISYLITHISYPIFILNVGWLQDSQSLLLYFENLPSPMQ